MMYGIARAVAIATVAGIGSANHASFGAAQAQPPSAQAPQAQRGHGTPGLIVNVEFAGGTVAQYVAALKEACKPQPVNVVLSEGAATDKLAPISLRQASLAAAMQAIPAASSSGVNSWQIVQLPDTLPGNNSPRAETSDSAPVFQVYRAPSKKDAGQQRVIMEVYSVQKIVGRETDPAVAERKIAAVLTAAETALRMDERRATPPELKFHKESGLLIVRGEPDDVMAVKDVIERMSDDSGRAAELAAQRLSVQQQMEINVRKAEVNAKAARSRLDAAKDRLVQVEKLRAAGDMSTIDAAELKAEVEHLAAAAEMAQLEVESAKVAAQGGTAAAMVESITRVAGRDAALKSLGGAEEVQAEIGRLRDENAALRDQLAEMSKHLKDLEAAMAASRANNRK